MVESIDIYTGSFIEDRNSISGDASPAEAVYTAMFDIELYK